MQYLRTRVATDIEPSALARFDDDKPSREIGLDAKGGLLFAGPDPITQAEFETQWALA